MGSVLLLTCHQQECGGREAGVESSMEWTCFMSAIIYFFHPRYGLGTVGTRLITAGSNKKFNGLLLSELSHVPPWTRETETFKLK